MAKKEEEKAVAAQAKTAVGAALDFSADVGAGMEGVDKDSFAIPFLRVLQSNSPQVNEANGEYIEGARAGMLLNTATRQVYDGKEGLTILPCAFQRRFIQWGPRGSDRGYMGEFMPEQVDALMEQGLVVRSEEDNRLYRLDEPGETPHEKRTDRMVDTRSHFCIVIDPDGNFGQVLLALSSTQIKKSKQLMATMKNAKVDTAQGKVTPPTWMNKIKLTTVAESNDDGDWYGVQFSADGFIETQDLYDAGKAFNKDIEEGRVQADHSKGDDGGDKAASGKF